MLGHSDLVKIMAHFGRWQKLSDTSISSSLFLPTSTSLIQKTSDFFIGHTHLLCSNPFLPDKRLSSSFMVEDPHLGTRLKTTTLDWAEVRLALLGTTPLPSKKVCFSDK